MQTNISPVKNNAFNTTEPKRNIANEKGVLDKDAFLKLLLTQLKYQDPTSPMETDKMLSQTADLTVVESQKNIAKAIEEMSKRITTSVDFNLVGIVGKIADTGKNKLTLSSDGQAKEFSLYFPDDYTKGTLTIKDANGQQVYSESFNKGSEGNKKFTWNGKKSNGEDAKIGTYSVKANYTTKDGKQKSVSLGVYKIDSIKFTEKGPLLKLGENYMSYKEIKEIKEKP